MLTRAWWKSSFWNFRTPQDRVETVLAWALAGFLLSVPISGWWDDTQTYVRLVEPNKAVLHQGGWFFNPKLHDLHVSHGQWYLDDGEQLMVPIDGPWNNYYFIRFEDHGRVFRINKSEKTQAQLKVVDGEWSELFDDGTWGSVYEYDYLDGSSN